MRYPKYLFLTYGDSQWWSNFNDDECTSDDIAHALEFSLAVSYFHMLLREKMFYNTCYDATWALAYVLHGIIEDIDLYVGDYVSDYVDDNATDMEYGCSYSSDGIENSRELHSLINEGLRNINFTGKSVSKL